MHCFPRAAVAATMVFLWPQFAAADDRVLTFDQAIELARTRAPAILSAQGRIDEARARLVGASVWFRDNPVLEGTRGVRTSDRGDSAEVAVGLTHTFELGGRRDARIERAKADIHRATAMSQDAERQLLRDVAASFYRAIHAEERVRLATTAETLASELLRIAERRRTAGDASTLEVNVAGAVLARARADLRSKEADRAVALGDLQLLLGFGAEESIAVTGDLRDRQGFALDDLVIRAAERADLQVLAAELRKAEADRRLGEGLAWPNLGIGVRYEREEGANIALGTLSITLPIFEHGAGVRAEADARARRLRQEMDVGRRVASAEVRSTFHIYRLRTAAVEEFERGVLPLLEEIESMSHRAYETGAMGLAELLAVRREVLDMRRDHLDRLLEAAVARVDLQAAAGAFE